MSTFDMVSASALYVEVLSAVRSNRPAIRFSESAQQALESLPGTWDETLVRSVHKELTQNLRGLVEDAGYDPDLLPTPPAEPRTMTLSADKNIEVRIPSPTDADTAAVRAIPGASWNGTERFWTVPALGIALEGLRNLVRNHKVVPDTHAIEVLKEVAAKLAADPTSASLGIVDLSEKGRVEIRLTVAYPPLADQIKRVPSMKWDPTVNAYTAPASRLRDTISAVKGYALKYTPAVEAALNDLNAPLVYDGTLDGLRGVPLSDLHCVDDKKQERFSDFGIRSIFDLLLLTPRRYLDRANLTPIRSLVAGEEVGVLAVVANISTDPKRRLVRITVTDHSGKINVTYFNAIWQAKRFRIGDEVAIWGKVDAWQGSGRPVLAFTNPIMDPVGDDTLAVIPIYPQSAKSRVTTWEIHQAAAEALRRLGVLTDPLPEDLMTGLSLMSRQEALKAIHLPSSLAESDAARARLAFDELFRMQTALLLTKQAEESETGVGLEPTGVLTKALFDGLPYPLTGAQSRVMVEVEENLRAGHPMHRLLQGDVGAGKTTIALASLLMAVESGFQGALMAPTEILASQLYKEMTERSEGLKAADGSPVRVEFFSNKLRGKNRDKVLADLASGDINIAVGTHALLVDDVRFHNLGLVVVDEQHRFGVEQRSALRAKGPVRVIEGKEVHIRPDMLVMTATPIPRTASMTVFGDLDVSVLDELPPGRTPIATRWIDSEPDLAHSSFEPWQLIREQVAEGRQAYVVCPLVEESEKMQAASAVETFESLQAGALHGLKIGLVHGQQNADKRTETMRAFRAGELDVLVATTVIEVGVNVPNSTVMVILDAVRFGIAQLHQLRGRVGRGSHASYCVLVGRGKSTDSRARMEALVESTDGFYLSEVDLALRGHGQIFGTAQSGESDLRVADLDRDKDLLVTARTHARELVAADPGLRRRPALRAEIISVLGDGAHEWLGKS
jgi:ATP-dependent DNA helicase RecG